MTATELLDRRRRGSAATGSARLTDAGDQEGAVLTGPPILVATRPARWAPSSLTKLLTASFVSFMGDGMLATALPLLAASFSRSPLAVGAVAAARTLPWLLFGLVAGVIADRVNRRRLMIATDVARGALVALIALAAGTGHASIAVLCVLAFVIGVADTLHDCADGAIIPEVVEPEQIDRANSLLFTGETISDDLAGRALGGILFTATAAMPFLVDSVSFFACALILMTLTTRLQRGSADSADSGDSPGLTADEASPAPAVRPMQQLREGLRAIADVPLLRVSLAVTVVVSLGQWMALSVLVLFALEKLHLSSGAGYGMLMAATAIGGIVGGVVAPRVIRRAGYAAVLLGAIGMSGLTFLVLAMTSSPLVAGLALGVQFTCMVAGRIVLVGARQRNISMSLLGRVAGALRSAAWCATAAGSLLGGVLASRFGLQAPIAFSGLLFVGTAIVLAKPIVRAFRTFEVIDLR